MTIKHFKKVWDQKREMLSSNPDKCAVSVKVDSQLVEGFMSRVQARDFDIVVDQNKGMGGTNQGPRPSEYVLAALAACQEVTYRLYADALDIPLEDVSVSLTGHSDARGFFGLDDSVRAGFSHVTGEIKIQSSASDNEIERLQQAVNQHCPVLDDLRNPVSVKLGLVRK
ncbi:MAG: OsmC family protein [Gammaproteobacteria bacterium]|nr:OsmC family protein [Gammaproteobacteria bacterium]